MAVFFWETSLIFSDQMTESQTHKFNADVKIFDYSH